MTHTVTAREFKGIQGVTIDDAAVRAHVIQPAHVMSARSSRGLEDELPHATAVQLPHPPAGPAPYFDVDGFGKALHAALKDSVVGYCLRLRQNNSTISTLVWNWAQTPADNSEGWATNVRIHVASCSKLITAIAMTRLLIDKNIAFDASIINYLPTYWLKGPNINKITFRHLMTHRSGFTTPNGETDFATMKSKVAAGVAGVGQYSYENMNFGLCRILISTINEDISPDYTVVLPMFNDASWDLITIQAYKNYVQSHIFTPSGVSGPGFDHSSNYALAYKFPVSGKGWNSGDLSTVAGGAGWHISVYELLSVMGTFRHSGTIMSIQQAQNLLDSSFGIDQTIPTPLGNMYNKNGAWYDQAPPGERREQAVAFFLPQGMELVAVANSPIGLPEQSFRGIVSNAYKANVKTA